MDMNVKSNATTGAWLVSPKPNPRARLRLFCLPYAGGGAHIFRSWADRLPPTVEVSALQLPGRGTRLMEPPFTQLSSLIEAVAQALRSRLDKPFVFFGHSMGALVGFELARALRRGHHLEPAHLFVSGCHAPQIPDPNPIYALPEAEFLRELRRLNGLPEEVLENTELLQLMLPTLRADCMVTETYVYREEPLLRCPVTAFGGLQDPLVGRQHLEPWRDETSGTFALRMLPGDHFFVHTAEGMLLEALNRELHAVVSTI